MPCFGGGFPEGSKLPVSREEAMMCAIFNALDKKGITSDILDSIDYEKCGLDRKYFEHSIRMHKDRDEQSR